MATNAFQTAEGQSDATAWVAGAVLDAQGRGRRGLDLFLEQVSPGGKTVVLGKAVSGQAGAYRIAYDRDAVLGKTSGQLSLRVRVGESERDATRSPLLRNAPARVAGLDLVLPKDHLDGSSDFERVRADLSAAAKRAGIDLAALRETPEQPDASLLAAETGHPVAKVTLLALALRLSHDSKGQIGAELAYGLGSQGVPFGAAALAERPKEALAAHLETAIERGIVSDAARQQLQPALDSVAVRLRGLGIATAAQGPIGRIFAATAGTEQARRFFEIVADHQGDADALWDKVGRDPALEPLAKDLRFAAQMAVLVGAQPKAAAMLRSLRETGEIADLSALVTWTAADWEARLEQAGVDAPGIADDADAATRQAARRAYARGIDRVVEAYYPRLYAQARIAGSALPGHDAIAAFLGQAEGFSLSGHAPRAYLRERPALANLLAADQDALPTLAALARTTRVARRVAPAIALVADGLGSARAVAGTGPWFFARRYAERFGSTTLALQAHARASHMTMAVAELWVQAAPGQQGTRTMPPPGVTEMPAFPDWATLFGADDGCACNHCGSVTGPGAYLVDVLEFLRQRPARVADTSALDILLRRGRRPDLAEIELTCENAEIRLPYIDLANEILEDAVAPPPPFPPAPVGIAGPVAAQPGRPIVSAVLRHQMNAALGLEGQADFEIAADAGLHSLAEGQPWIGARPSWRVEDRLFTYSIVTTAENTLAIANRGRNTRGPAAERLLSPQYVNGRAYDLLARAYYPWSLPFARPLAEARVGLAALDDRLASLMEAFAPGTPEDRRRRPDLANERLGLGTVDAALVTWTQPAGLPALDLDAPWRHWGFAAEDNAVNPVPDPADSATPIDAGNWVSLLTERLDLLMDRGQLSVEEVLALLDTRYVNPVTGAGDRLTIELVSTDPADPATCRARWLALRGLDQAALIRIARLVRLSRRSGLSCREIDQALVALGAAEPDQPFLNALAQLVALRERLGADWQGLAACFIPVPEAPAADAPAADALRARYWAPTGAARSLDRDGAETRRAPTLYERLFRPALNPAAGLRWFPADPGGLGGLDLRDGLPGLAAAFGVSVADLARLADSDLVLPVGAGVADSTRNLRNLARLHRHGLLAARLGLGAADYLAALRLFDPDPFASPARLADFVATLDRALQGPLSITELTWLTRRQGDQDEAARTRADLDLLETLRVALRAVIADNRFVPLDAIGEAPTLDPDGSLCRRKLVALGLPASLADAAVAALSGTAVYTQSDILLPAPLAVPAVPPCEIPLAALPAGVDVAVLSEGRLVYLGTSGVAGDPPRLRATEVLGDNERQALSDASSDGDYRAALTRLFDLQDALHGRVAFDPGTGTLQFRGPMPGLWRTHLDILSAEPTWRAAVDRLYDAPRGVAHQILRAWRPTALSAPLDELPIRLPPGLDGRLHLDRSVHPAQLRLTGPLLDSEVAALRAAAPGADPVQAAFRVALDALVVAAGAVAVDPADRLVADACLDALLDDPLTADERYRRLLAIILPRVAEMSGEATVIQTLAAALDISTGTAGRLARVEIREPGGGRPAVEVLRDPAFVDSPAALLPSVQSFPAQHRVLRRLRQAALIATRYGLTAPDFAHLATMPGWPSLARLPVAPLADDAAAPVPAADLLRFADYRTLRDRIPGGHDTLAELAGTAAAGRLALLARRLNRPAVELERLAGPTLLALAPADLADERGLLRLLTALHRLDRLRLSAGTVAALRATPLSADAGRAVIAAVGAGMDGAQWQEVGRGLFDQIRVASRDALLAHLLARGRPAQNGVPAQRWRTPGELFGHFLIDVEMGACMETSRLRQAMSSVQLFVQRCQLGLEPEIVTEIDDGWRQWEWMRNYRVWEANRKVFLWPENLLEPAFMDVKSQLFRELEADLGQGEVTLEGAARAMLGYLEKLKRIARVRPVTMAREPIGDHQEVLHVLAATLGDPREHHYRRRDDTQIWSPWEKVDLDIKSEHVLLHVWKGRPFLFWLDLMRRATDPRFEGETVSATQVFDVTLCWSELRDGAWTPQRQSRQTLTIPESLASSTAPQESTTGSAFESTAAQPPGGQAEPKPEPDTLGVVFRIDHDAEDRRWVRWRSSRHIDDSRRIYPAFRIDFAHAEPEIEDEPRRDFLLWRRLPLAVYRRAGQEILRPRGNDFRLELPHANHDVREALTVRRNLSIIQPPTFADGDIEGSPFLFRDSLRAFVVTPVPADGGTSTIPSGWIPEDVDVWFDPRWDALPEDIGAPPGPFPEPAPDLGPVINPVREYDLVTRADWGAMTGRPLEAETADRTIGVIGGTFTREAEAAAETAASARAMVVRNNAGDRGLLANLGLGALADLGGGAQMQPLMLRSGIDSLQVAYGADDSAQAILSDQRENRYYSIRLDPQDTGPSPFARHTGYRYRFETFYHPYADTLIQTLIRDGMETMLSREVQLRPFDPAPTATPTHQVPAFDFQVGYVSAPAFVEWMPSGETLDFDYNGACSVYNWELFFHVPMLVADRLAQSQRFDDARHWLHLIFDPRDQSSTAIDEDGTSLNLGSARYWQTKPLFENSLRTDPAAGADDTVVERERIERILTVLAAAAVPDANTRLSDDDRAELDRFQHQVTAMRRKPFRPYAIARLRTSAYQRAVVMKYLDILIRWGDQLFRQDTMESINAATQLYLLAAELRGREGESMPPRAVAAPQTYASLAPRLDGLGIGNPLVEIEAFVAPSAAPDSRPAPGLPPPAMLAFCMPRNDKLSSLWATVADRLFKLRHCLNIEGVARQLALFEPPIDPALLARAVAAGLDIGAALADLDGPTPGRRFRVVIRQAAELAGEVRGLGAALLAAWEKRDGEELSRLRATHERALVERAGAVRDFQVTEAETSLAALRSSRDSALERYRHYRPLLGEGDLTDPAEGAKIPMRPPRPDTVTHSVDVFKFVAPLLSHIPFTDEPPDTQSGGVPVNPYEDFELAMLEVSQGYQLAGSGFDLLAGFANNAPNFNAAPCGTGPTFGGANIGASLSAAGAASRGLSGAVGFAATMAGRAAQYATRADDWAFQQNLAAREIMQIDLQILAADLRRQIAVKEQQNQLCQLDDLSAYEAALGRKFTGQELHDWMAARLADLHFQMYQLAYDWAKRAQRAARIELQRPQMDYIRFGHWDGLRKGLLAGEALAMDIRRLEMAYDELDVREESMVKHVSLTRTDPAALVRLRETGVATFAIPEALFDLDCPGQYLRRLKSVAVTVPCVTGPYTGVHARLTLLRSSIRISDALAGRGRVYARERNRDDPRFTDLVGQPQSIVTSTAQNDAGLFETNLEDPRYLPFEGLGAISEWRVELPSAFRAFDYDSISDLVLHLRYTARNGGEPLRSAVQTELTTALNALESASATTGLVRWFSLRHEVPTAWRRMLEAPEVGMTGIDLPIERDRLPFFVDGRRATVTRITVLARIAPDHLADYRGALRGNLAPVGTLPPGDPLDFSPWLGTLLQASWEGVIDLDHAAICGAPPRACPWRLSLQHTPAAGAGPIAPAALEDLELLVGYRLR